MQIFQNLAFFPLAGGRIPNKIIGERKLSSLLVLRLEGKQMKSATASILLITMLVLVSAPARAEQAYRATILSPNGVSVFQPWGISGTQVVGQAFFDHYGHAYLYNSDSSNYTNLQPGNLSYSNVSGICGSQVVGYGGKDPSYDHALLWDGSGGCIDLNPIDVPRSYAVGTDGIHQVGDACYDDGSGTHALLWSGSASSYVDLNPGYGWQSGANGVWGSQQVGSIYHPTFTYEHAALWNGSADSCVDLNPSGFFESRANSIRGTQQVGYGRFDPNTFNDHALLWYGTAESCVDLNPSAFVFSQAFGTNGAQQVGFGLVTVDGPSHALVWNSSADDYVDLTQFLPSKFTYAEATAIDANGNIVGYTYGPNGTVLGVLWEPVPEPATMSLLGLGLLMLRRHKRRGN